MDTTTIILAALIVGNIILSIFLLLRSGKRTNNSGAINDLESSLFDIGDSLSNGQKSLIQRIDSSRAELVQAQNTNASQMQQILSSSSEATADRLNRMDKEITKELQENLSSLKQSNEAKLSEMLKTQNANTEKTQKILSSSSETTIDRLNQMDKEILRELQESLAALKQSNEEKLSEMLNAQNANAEKMQKIISSSSEASIERLHQMETNVTKSLNENLETIRSSNEQKLSELQTSVNEKLDKSLNERLDSSFAKVTEQLSELYKSLGELGKMSSDISNLNRSLSNVKLRGTWGEAQLRDIIRETMVPSQYEENIITKPGSTDPVEFAIKIPSKDSSAEYILLPIDSKFPLDRYNEVVDASESADKQKLSTALKQLEIRVKDEARKIRDKYISVPQTTNFAVMYLPTESLYAEVLRINGLAEQCQNQYGIIIAGPTTITALLNSLRVGFQNLTLSKKTSEVQKLLVAVKDQFGKMDELISSTQKKLDAASAANEKLAKRSGMIQKRLAKISTGMPDEERALLPDPGVDETGYIGAAEADEDATGEE